MLLVVHLLLLVFLHEYSENIVNPTSLYFFGVVAVFLSYVIFEILYVHHHLMHDILLTGNNYILLDPLDLDLRILFLPFSVLFVFVVLFVLVVLLVLP